MSELDKEQHTIVIDPRAYNFMKSTAITNIVDALIELITNSDDAYQKNKDTLTKPYKIDIEVDYKSPNEDIIGHIRVRDQASGLTAEQMQKCFTIVGQFNSDASARGFFSRGAKDISALGKVTFESIKDGKYSNMFINADSTTRFNNINEDVTEEIRSSLGIINNGLSVTIDIKNTFHLNEPKFFFETFPRTLSIRNIMASTAHNITMTTKNHTSIEDRSELIRYTFPKGNILLDVIYTVPKYGYQAHFTVFKLDEPYSGNPDPRFNESGFMITSGNVIHGTETFGKYFKFNPDLKYLYGSIHCDGINSLLYNFDETTSNRFNPFPLVDPNRISGINRKHPFYGRLLSVPLTKIEQILLEFNKSKTDDILMNINLQDFSNLAQQLNLVDLNLIEDNTSVQKLVTDRQSELVKVNKTHRQRLITVERNFMFQLHQIKAEQNSNETAVIEFTPEEATNLPPTVKSIKLSNGNVAVPIKNLFTQEFTPPVLINGNYTDIPEDKASDYELYKEISDKVKDYNIKDMYIQDRLNATNNVDKTASDWSKSTTSNEMEIKFTRDDTDNYKYKIKKEGQKISIIINTGNSILKEFMNTESTINGTTSSKAIIMLNEMLTDAFVRLLVEKDISTSDSKMFTKLDSAEILSSIYGMHDAKVKLVEDSVFEIIKKLLERRKEAKTNTN